jgi:succinoglycan biosynthesis protein ExoM
MEKSIYSDLMIEFDPIFGRSGGEDIDFFRRVIQRGKLFVWCKEAPVFETVILDRLKASFYIKKNLRIGGLNGSRKRKESANKTIILKNFFASILYFCFFIIGISIGKHLYLKYLCKVLYNLSWFLAYFFNILLLSKKNDR